MARLSKPSTKAGRLQRACLTLLYEHEEQEAIPTSIRFLFYELLDRGVIPKVYRAEPASSRLNARKRIGLRACGFSFGGVGGGLSITRCYEGCSG